MTSFPKAKRFVPLGVGVDKLGPGYYNPPDELHKPESKKGSFYVGDRRWDDKVDETKAKLGPGVYEPPTMTIGRLDVLAQRPFSSHELIMLLLSIEIRSASLLRPFVEAF
jgi:hypothetical protein